MKFATILVLLLSSLPVFAQPDERSIGDKFVSDLHASFYEGIAYFTSPFRMDAQDAMHLAWFGGGTAVTLALDKEAHRGMSKVSRSSAMNAIMDIGHGYGDLPYALYLPAGLYIGGLVSDNDHVRVTGRQIFQALLYSGAVTQVLKWMVGRERPHVSGDPFNAKPFNFRDPHDDYFSMPSGHATVAFAVSSVLAERIDNVYASIGLYSLASVTAISRLYHNRHWLSDVAVAATIGTATGIFVTRQGIRSDDNWSDPLEMIVSPFGIGVEYKF